MKYKFNEEQKEEIKAARRSSRDKQIEKRLEVPELHCNGVGQKEIAEKTGYHRSHVCNLIKLYFEKGLQAVAETHYGGNRRNISSDEETGVLEQFGQKVEEGQILDIREIENAYQEKVDHRIGNAQIYRVLDRHGWSQIILRSRRPKKASDEVIETSRKLNDK